MFAAATLTVFLVVSAPGATGETVLLDFYSDTCGPCRTMAPTVARLEASGHPVRKINIRHYPRLSQQYRIRAVPCFVMLSNGREIERVEGVTSYSRLERMCQRARAMAPSATMLARGQSPRPSQSFPLPVRETRNPLTPSRQTPPRERIASRRTRARNPRLFQPRQEAPQPRTERPTQPPLHPQPRTSPEPLRPSRVSAVSSSNHLSPQERAMAATVRLIVSDADGASYGTGTIIDTRQGMALILTCAHIFRQSKGKGKIQVDLFSASGRNELVGRMLDFDLKHDVALVVIQPKTKATAALVAPPTFRLERGDRVFSIGCDRGKLPSLQESHITMINRFLGPANVEVAGEPDNGRSGGGLFSKEGFLIGVCNAANPTDNEGMYAALPVIYGELNRMQLRFVYAGSSTPSQCVINTPPTHPKGVCVDRFDELANVIPPKPPIRENGASLGRLSHSEQAILDAIRRQPGQTELICVLRSKDESAPLRRVIVLDHPSDLLLSKLSQEYQRQQRTVRYTTGERRRR